MAAQVLVLTGRGRYEDPWHDHAATSALVVDALREQGVDARLRSTFPDALDDVDALRAVVVNAGRGRSDPDFDGDDAAWRGFHDRLHALVAAGTGVLGLHQAASTFADDPRWAALLGGSWTARSWHPPLAEARFAVRDADHRVTRGLAEVVAVDEQYCDLEVRGARVLLTTRHDGVDHPVVWAAPGPHRVLYDALGHDVRSYASASRRALLARELDWVMGARAPR
ncbi:MULTISPECIES: ThuA domain-containing protein [unclassified Actinotalea]|uniref:ThuA domain-containing protein n=1 Tax=unclassified Actinotalea TaxID=2638618 RepID=UPI0015F5F5F3|nr:MULTISPECIES: ThuA domain-containing protein [unclassified Actinotalea]